VNAHRNGHISEQTVDHGNQHVHFLFRSCGYGGNSGATSLCASERNCICSVISIGFFDRSSSRIDWTGDKISDHCGISLPLTHCTESRFPRSDR
jgi:hypothetical protein